MLGNYFRMAWRNITKHKLFTIINVVGLAVGICSCIVIYIITSYEFSFDKFHPDKERIYRITGENLRNNGEKEFLNSIIPDVAGIQNDIPGFEAKAGIFYYGAKIDIPRTGSKPAEFFSNSDVIITWPGYFDIFKYDWLAGNPKTALNEPYKVVLSESKAHKYFGNEPFNKIVGKTIIYNDSLQVAVSGIIKDWTEHTDFPVTDIISIGTASNGFLKRDIPVLDWSSLQPHRSMVFVKLNRGITAAQMNLQLAQYIKSRVKTSGFGTLLSLKLQPLDDIHFTNDYYQGDDGDFQKRTFAHIIRFNGYCTIYFNYCRS
ncbi:MAG: ABC transporter permease [Ginsengibacter sp.]